jgi:hypothetical protein
MARTYPTPDESRARLHAAGWSVSETGASRDCVVSGSNRGSRIRATGKTQAEAWHRACQQAEGLGLLGRQPTAPAEPAVTGRAPEPKTLAAPAAPPGRRLSLRGAAVVLALAAALLALGIWLAS